MCYCSDGLCSDMRERQGSYSDGVVTNMADILLKTVRVLDMYMY